VGDGAVISGQSFVVKDVPPYSVVAGSPARVVRKLDEATQNEERSA
jgi:acetyltransferase-like isoleucine patch superfamily enzyme